MGNNYSNPYAGASPHSSFYHPYVSGNRQQPELYPIKGSHPAGFAPAHGKVDRIIRSYPIVVFTRANCQYCDHAKILLNSSGLTFTEIMLDASAEGKAMSIALLRRTGSSVLPQIFVQGRYIGGVSDLERSINSGELHGIGATTAGLPYPYNGPSTQSWVQPGTVTPGAVIPNPPVPVVEPVVNYQPTVVPAPAVVPANYYGGYGYGY
jgi:glutaredoxin 3